MGTWLISVLSIVGGALLTLITTLIVNRVSYKQEYYKMIIEKRIKAYNTIEHFVNSIKDLETKALTDLNGTNKDDFFNLLHKEIEKAKSVSVWLSNKMKESLNEFGVLLTHYELVINSDEVESRNIDIYSSISENKKKIEQVLKMDLTSLHKVRQFLRSK